jgi:hypothetical protein
MARKSKAESQNDRWRLVLQMSDKGGVAKSTFCGMLLGWALGRGMKAKGIDPDSGNRTFYRQMNQYRGVEGNVECVNIENDQDRDEMDHILTKHFGPYDVVIVDGMPGQRKQWVDWLEGMDLFENLELINLGVTFALNIDEDYDSVKQGIAIMEKYREAPVDWLLVKVHHKVSHTDLWDRKSVGPQLASSLNAKEIMLDNIPAFLAGRLKERDLTPEKGMGCEEIEWMNQNRLRKFVKNHYERFDRMNAILGGDTASGKRAFAKRELPEESELMDVQR